MSDIPDRKPAGIEEVSSENASSSEDVSEEWSKRICSCIEEMTGIPDRRVSIFHVKEIPRSSSGKIRYAELR